MEENKQKCVLISGGDYYLEKDPIIITGVLSAFLTNGIKIAYFESDAISKVIHENPEFENASFGLNRRMFNAWLSSDMGIGKSFREDVNIMGSLMMAKDGNVLSNDEIDLKRQMEARHMAVYNATPKIQSVVDYVLSRANGKNMATPTEQEYLDMKNAEEEKVSQTVKNTIRRILNDEIVEPKQTVGVQRKGFSAGFR